MVVVAPRSLRKAQRWQASRSIRQVAWVCLLLVVLWPLPLEASPSSRSTPVTVKTPPPLASPLASPAVPSDAGPGPATRVEELTAPPQGVSSLPLAQALAEGLARNPRLKVAAEQVIQARARYNELQSGKRIKLNIDSTTTWQKQSSIDTTKLVPAGTAGIPSQVILGERLQDQAQASLAQLLTTFGRLENQIVAAFIQIGAAVQDMESVRRQLLLDLKVAYFERVRAEANDRVTALNLDSARQTLQDTELRFHQGLLARYDVLQAELEVTDATLRRDQAATDVVTSLVRLRAVMFEPTDALLWTVEPTPIVVDPATLPSALEEVAYARRPELAVLNLNLSAARRLVSAAKADNSPTLTLQFNYLTSAGTSLGPVDATNGMLVLSWPLIDGGQRNARVMDAESKLRVIEDNIALARQNVRKEVLEAWARLLLAQENLRTSERRLDIAVSFHYMARLRFVGGVGTSLEMQNAVRSLNDARLELVLKRNELDLAFAGLEQSLGVDFPDRRLVIPPPAAPPASPASKPATTPAPESVK